MFVLWRSTLRLVITPYTCRSYHPLTVYYPKLTKQQVTSCLRMHELSIDFKGQAGVVSYVDSNFLRSNNPMEDRRAIAKSQYTNGMFLGVFDGHSGCACAQAISERLFPYVSVSMLQHDDLEYVTRCIDDGKPSKLLNWYRSKHEYVNEYLRPMYMKSLNKYAKELLSDFEPPKIENSMETSFLRLDSDISSESFNEFAENTINMETVPIALSGSCACVVHVEGRNIHVANVGDCQAVLGSLSADGVWIATPLSFEHNADNESEVERVKSSHPAAESHGVLRGGRLLGELIPLRSFGDMRYKWDLKKLKMISDEINKKPFPEIPSYHIKAPKDYHSPPYLIANPEITSHPLTLKDKFIILATDGLWDMVSPDKAVNLVADHLDGRLSLEKFDLVEGGNKTLGNINKLLVKRKSGIANRPVDTNVATHLIRYALGSSDMGIEHRKLSAMLTLPEEVVREFRDDITVIIVHLDVSKTS